MGDLMGENASMVSALFCAGDQTLQDVIPVFIRIIFTKWLLLHRCVHDAGSE